MTAAALTAAKRSMALAGSPAEKLAALKRELAPLAVAVAHGFVDRQIVVDEMIDHSGAIGLTDAIGEAPIAYAIADALDNPPDGNDADSGVSSSDELESYVAANVSMQGIEWFWPGRFAKGKLALLAGLPDKGKGQVCAYLVAAATAGVALPCGEGHVPQGNIIWFNAEDGMRDTVIPRLAAAGADLSRVHFITGTCNQGKKRLFSILTDLHLLKKKIEHIGNVVLVIIDPISAYLGIGKMDGRSQGDVRGMLTPLKDLAEATGVLVLGIMHFNKKNDVTSALLRIADSIAFTATARHVYAIIDDPENDKLRLFIKVKNNLAPQDQKALRYGFGFNPRVGHDPVRDMEIGAPYVEWSPEGVDITANDAMQASTGSACASREAKDFLIERLEAGAVPADEILEEAKQAGIGQRTLYKVKKDLKIISKKGQGGGWLWTLPAGSRLHS